MRLVLAAREAAVLAVWFRCEAKGHGPFWEVAGPAWGVIASELKRVGLTWSDPAWIGSKKAFSSRVQFELHGAQIEVVRAGLASASVATRGQLRVTVAQLSPLM